MSSQKETEIAWGKVELDIAAEGSVLPSSYDPPAASTAGWDEVDTTLDASFPASDAPSWTLGP
jgi:hypothetical protein